MQAIACESDSGPSYLFYKNSTENRYSCALLCYKFILKITVNWALADSGFPSGGANSEEDANLLFDHPFPKTAWKWRNFCPLRPLDAPVLDILLKWQTDRVLESVFIKRIRFHIFDTPIAKNINH